MQTIKEPKEVKAIKPHVCNFCACRIPKGDTYVKSVHVHDGGVYDWKAHKHCAQIATRLKMYDGCDDGLTQDDFIETIHTEHDEILIAKIPDEQVQELQDVVEQLRHVGFRYKLGYVIRHYAKLDK